MISVPQITSPALVTDNVTLQTVEDRFGLSTSLAESLIAQAEASLLTLVQENLSSIESISTIFQYWLQNPLFVYNKAANPLLNIQIAADMAPPVIDPITMPSFPSIPEYVDTLGQYTSTELAATLNQLIQEIYYTNTGVQPAVEDALYNRALMRQELDDQKLIERTIARSASLGWSKPPGAHTAAMRSAETEIYRAHQLYNYEILIARYDLIQKNYFHATDSIIKVDEFLAEFMLKSQTVGVQVFLAKVQAFAETVKGLTAEVNAEATVDVTRANVYESFEKARSVIADVLAKGIELEIKQTMAAIQASEEGLKLESSLGIEKFKLDKTIADSAAKILAQMAAAALGSVSASAGVQWHEARSDSTSNSASQGVSVSVINETITEGD